MNQNPTKRLLNKTVITLSFAFLISACGGGGGGGGGGSNNEGETTPPNNTPPGDPNAAVLNLTLSPTKNFVFTWTDVADATFYRIMENADGSSGFSQLGPDIAPGTQTFSTLFPLYERIGAQYILESCISNDECLNSDVVIPANFLADGIGYFKASNTDAGDNFGDAMQLSSDGLTLAVGAPEEQSGASGINGDQTNNDQNQAGAVYIFTRSSDTSPTWTQQAYIKASNANQFDNFGSSVTLAENGNTLAVGAPGESSDSVGINGDETNTGASRSGAAYVFTRSGTTWSQQAYIKASDVDIDDEFGINVTLSADGNTLAVSSVNEASSSGGINGDDSDNLSSGAGAAYVFVRDDANVWSQQAYIKAAVPGAPDVFGAALSLSDEGDTLAVGAYLEDSNATGINGSQSNNFSPGSGAAYVFVRDGANIWSQQAYIKASNNNANDNFGESLSLSGDGDTLAVGARREDSSATGTGGDQANNDILGSGAVYIFTRDGTVWSQQQYIKPSNTDNNDNFGLSIDLSTDGNTLAVSSILEDSAAIGLGGEQTLDTADSAGSAYVFTRDENDEWTQQAYIKASNSQNNARLGESISLSGDGDTLAIGASSENSSATGVDGDQTDTSAVGAGAVYVY